MIEPRGEARPKLVSLTRQELELTVEEAAAVLTGGRIQHVHDVGDHKVLLEVHARGERRYLLLSARPGFSRAHLAERRPPSVPEPSPFVMLLRKHLGGACIVQLALLGADRVVRLDATGPCALVGELTGRHANLFLLDGQARILGSLRPNLSHRRELWPGQPYRYPLPVDRPAPPPRFDRRAPGLAAEALYERLERVAETQAIEAEIERALRETRRRIERRIEAIEEDRQRAGSADRYRRLGELLVANLGRVPRGASAVSVTDWTAEPPAEVEVPLDPSLSPRDNAERYFHRYRKYRESLPAIAAQRERAERERAAVARWEERFAAARGALEALRELRAALVGRGLLRERRPTAPPARSREEPAPPYRRFVSRDGRPILVGRGAEDNDALTFRVARGNDLWMHARDYPGAHVVVPLGRGEEPSQQTLLDAATLAAHYSQAKDAAVVDIAYTRRKFVHKPKGSAPGRVALSESRTIAVRIERERLERLMRRVDLEE